MALHKLNNFELLPGTDSDHGFLLLMSLSCKGTKCMQIRNSVNSFKILENATKIYCVSNSCFHITDQRFILSAQVSN
jgi:hypothetical protein